MPIRYRTIPGGRRVVDRSDVTTDVTTDGTIADVLAGVGDDPDAASAAIAEEEKSDKPRKTLISKLEAIRDA